MKPNEYRWSFNLSLRVLAFVLLAFMAPLARATPPTVWNGPLTNFVHSGVGGLSDQLTPSVVITRGARKALYNSVTEIGFNGGVSPAGTEWASGSLANFNTLTYQPFDSVVGGPGNSPSGSVNHSFVVHLIADNIFFSLTLTGWGNGNGGTPSFSYSRSTPTLFSTNQPTVSITSPSNSATFASPATVQIQATAAQEGGAVTNVQFFTNGVSAGSVIAAPFNLTVNGLANGSYTLTAIASASGLTATSAPVTISVLNKPTVSITSPGIAAVVAANTPFQITATAGQIGGAVTNVQFFSGATFLGAVTNSPFTVTTIVGLPVGNRPIMAVATGLGLSTTSSAVLVVFRAAPVVTVTSPTNNNVITTPATVSIQASATSTAGAITNMKVFRDGILVASNSASPISVTLSNLAAGPYSFTVSASAAAVTATSAVVNITVSAPASTPITNGTPTISNGAFSFAFSADSGSTYIIQSSSDFTNWTPIATNVAGSSSVLFSTGFLSNSNLFYRVVRPAGP